MNYEWLQSFATFAEKCNFTKAAEALHISQPALHVQIKKLSEEVGVVLYRRQGRTLLLTAEGRRLAGYSRALQSEQADLLAELRGESLRGSVVLAAGPGAFMYLLGPAIRQFPKSRWPLRLLNQSGPDALASVRDAYANLAVTVLDNPVEDLECTALRRVGQMLVVKNSHRLAKRRSVKPVDIADEEVVVAPAGRPHRQMLELAMRAEERQLNVSVEASGWEIMLDFVAKGMGVTVVNDFCKLPRGCVGVAMQGLPKVTYYLVGRKTSNVRVQRLGELIQATV